MTGHGNSRPRQEAATPMNLPGSVEENKHDVRDNASDRLNAVPLPLPDPDDIESALEIAETLIDSGIPVFAAAPILDAEGNWEFWEGANGFRLPRNWQKLTASRHVLEDPGHKWVGRTYELGDALCAVMGHGLDLLDVDPRNGGLESLEELSGILPLLTGRQETPSGGFHRFMASLAVASRDGVAPGIDVKAGKPDGNGRGFAFIAPTIRLSKTTGELAPYRWTELPDVESVAGDVSGRKLAERIQKPRQRRSVPAITTGVSRPSALDSVIGGGEHVIQRVRAHAATLRDAPEGQGNPIANDVAYKCGQYVGAGQIERESVVSILTEAIDGWTFRGKSRQSIIDTIERGVDDGMERDDRPWAAPETVWVPEGFDDVVGERVDDSATHLPEEFWCRPELKHIRQAAHSRGRSGDLVLADVLARVSAMVSPKVRFDAGMGEGSLNLFVAAIGRSGTGKSTASKIARELVPMPLYLSSEGQFQDGIGLASGEGLAEAYMGSRLAEVSTGTVDKEGTSKTTVKPIRSKIRDNVFIYVDEGQTLTAQAGRAGATIGPVLRAGWSGESLGQQGASGDTTRHVPSGSYSLGMVIGYQHSTAQALLSDAEAGAGTPQRFLWISGIDPSVPNNRVEYPGPLKVPALAKEAFGDEPWEGIITVDEEIGEMLWQRNLSVVHGKQDDRENLDSHIVAMALKVSSLLALLNGRHHVTREDWQLAGMIWKTSCAVRSEVKAYGAEQKAREAEARDDAAVIRATRVSIATTSADQTLSRIAKNLNRYANEEGAMTAGAMRRKLAGRDKPLFHEALEFGVSQGWLVEDGGKIVAGPSRPAE